MRHKIARILPPSQTQRLGDDQIAVGLIYNRNRVKPIGHAHTITQVLSAQVADHL